MSLGVFLGAGTVHALPYTFDADLGTPGLQPIIGFQAGTATVNILPVTDLSGLTVALDGNVTDFISQDWFLFQIEVTAGSVTSVGAGHPPVLAIGLGHFNDPDGTPSSGVIEPTYDDMPEFFFAGGISGLSDRLFTTYYYGDLPGSGLPPFIPAGTVSFMINDGMGVYSTPTDVVLVPEPSTAALLALGLFGLAAAGRRRA